nr:hypothetical protein GCM10025699_72120 [Microbacterium flavescens]
MPDLPETTTAIRVAVVDDQPLFASGLRMLIEAQPDLACVGTAVDGREALALVERESPDVVLMDLRMPVMNGLEATARILDGVSPDDLPRVVALTTIQRDEAVFGALKAGAYAFLTKDATPDDVITTIRAAYHGDPVPTAAAALDVVHEFAVPPTAPPRVDPSNRCRRGSVRCSPSSPGASATPRSRPRPTSVRPP